MDIRPESSIRAEITEIEAIPIALKTEQHFKRLNDLESEIRRRHPELHALGQLLDKCELFEIVKSYCTNINGDRNNRQSLDPTPVHVDHCFTMDKIGKTFPFQGRREESHRMYQFIFNQDETRQNAQESIEQNPLNRATNWDNFKRFRLPVTMGIAGIGKSELNRKGVSEHIKSLSEAYFNAASTREQQFITMMKDNKCCNIRLAMDEIAPPGEVGGVSSSIMVELLCVSLSYNLRDNGEKQKKVIENLVRNTPSLVLGDVLDFLTSYLGVESFLVNVDEANKIDEVTLTAVLKIFGYELCMGRKVYITVSGIYKQSVKTAIDFSGMRRKDVFLPPLKMEESLAIFHSLGLVQSADPTKQNRYFLHLLWLAGGVPRNLDYLVYTIARKSVRGMDTSFHQRDIPHIASYITDMGQSEVIAILGTWCPLCAKLHNDTPPDAVIASILSLCIAETTVMNSDERQRVLSETYTIERALHEEMLYIQSVEPKVVTLPPVFLHSLHKLCAGKDAVRLITLQTMEGVMSNRDNEELYLSVLIHRLRAASVMGRESISLYELLGTTTAIEDQPDVMVDTAGPWSLEKADSTVKTGNHNDFAHVGSGKVNTPTASFADAFIRLKIYGSNLTVDVLIQEKQSVIARQKQFEANKVTKTTHASDVQTERAKVGDNNLLVYITDCGQAANEDLNGKRRTLVITAAQTEKCFGRFVAQLKRFCLAQSYIDVKV